MYKLSIILPVFNVKDTIDKSFNSILNQTIGFNNLEIIFVDDCSTDGSDEIIKKYSKEYPNVKCFFLEKNSGIAGKPRNIGIEKSTTDYLMFLDSDDVFLENACELLYNNITENDLDMVSANYNVHRNSEITLNDWSYINLKENESIQVKSIDEKPNLLMTVPSVWCKIYKREFIIENNIRFPVGIPGEDLVFVSETLLKASGIKFINKPVVNYIPRDDSNESVTSKKDKKLLSGYLKAYTQLYWKLYEYNEDYVWFSPRNLYFWIKLFILSNLTLLDKVELLAGGHFLFKEFLKSTKIHTPKHLETFLKLTSEKEFLKAAKMSKQLKKHYLNPDEIDDNVKKIQIFSLFYGMDMKIGGLAKAVFNRSNILNNHGYKITLLNIDELKNFKYIIKKFKEMNFLNNDINFINIYEYYSEKNNKYSFKPLKYTDPLENEKNIIIEKIENNDNSITLNYYDSNYKKIIKSEKYIDDYLAIKKIHEHGKMILELFYTLDGYNYLTIKHKDDSKLISLKNRETHFEINFENIQEFYDYFTTEILLKNQNKSFLINESSSPIPNFQNIDNHLAYKIGCVHTNPYKGPVIPGKPAQNVAAFRNIESLSYIVVLTEALKKDIINEFNINTVAAIPNVLNYNEYAIKKEKLNFNKNKISIFARLSPEKNIADAIRAFKKVTEKKTDAVLEIYGRAINYDEINEEKKLKKIVKELHLEKNVIFKGHVKNVFEEMSNSVATLFVSKFEGLGMVVLESMVNATPVISYDLNYGPSDYIINGENGYLVKQYDIEELSNKIITLLNDPSKAIEMGQKAQEKILNEVTPENIFKKWDNLLKETYINSTTSDEIYDKPDKLDVFIKKDKTYNRLIKINSELTKENQKLKIRNEFLEKRTAFLKNKNKEKIGIEKLKKIFSKK